MLTGIDYEVRIHEFDERFPALCSVMLRACHLNFFVFWCPHLFCQSSPERENHQDVCMCVYMKRFIIRFTMSQLYRVSRQNVELSGQQV